MAELEQKIKQWDLEYLQQKYDGYSPEIWDVMHKIGNEMLETMRYQKFDFNYPAEDCKGLSICANATSGFEMNYILRECFGSDGINFDKLDAIATYMHMNVELRDGQNVLYKAKCTAEIPVKNMVLGKSEIISLQMKLVARVVELLVSNLIGLENSSEVNTDRLPFKVTSFSGNKFVDLSNNAVEAVKLVRLSNVYCALIADGSYVSTVSTNLE